MVEIIEGPKEGWHYEWTCKQKGCGAKLRALASDVRIGEFDGAYCESGEWKFYVTCPVCGEQKTLKDSDVPPLVQTQARKKSKVSWD